MPEDKEQRPAILNQNTQISIWLMLMLVGGVIWLHNQMAKLNTQIISVKTSLDGEIGAIKRTLDGTVANRWTSQDMEVWTLRAEKGNTNSIYFPDPREVVQFRLQQ